LCTQHAQTLAQVTDSLRNVATESDAVAGVSGYKRFILPGFLTIVGIVGTYLLVEWLAVGLSNVRPAYNLMPRIAGSTVMDVNFLLTLVLPVFLFEYALLAIPIAISMIAFNRIFRMSTYELGIFETGEDFGTMKMLRRAIVPALFALSSGEIFINLIPEGIFEVPAIDEATSSVILPWFHPLQTIVGTLIALGVGLVIFAPTWILNDSGIVSQVKKTHMNSRRCPDTEGIGRWFSNLFGGFAILAYPVTMFHRYFYLHFIVWGFQPTLENIAVSLLWTVGIPVLIMSFVLPFVMLHELWLRMIKPGMQSIARRMGAKNVQEERLMFEMTEQVQEYLGPEPYDPTKGRTDR
jgi:hypothetical protein